MSCPQCGCKVTYTWNHSDCGFDDDNIQRCSSCGHIFDEELEGIDEDDVFGDMEQSHASE